MGCEVQGDDYLGFEPVGERSGQLPSLAPISILAVRFRFVGVLDEGQQVWKHQSTLLHPVVDVLLDRVSVFVDAGADGPNRLLARHTFDYTSKCTRLPAT